MQLTKLKKRKNILIITLLNPFQASEHHRHNRLFSGVKIEMGSAKFVWTTKLWKILFKKMFVQTFFWRFQMTKFGTLRASMFKKTFFITNFTNRTHFTLTNVLKNYDHCFWKSSGNHYLKLIISATPFLSTKFSTVPLIHNVTMFSISKYNDFKENYSRKLF